jgi:hypothetical protein
MANAKKKPSSIPPSLNAARGTAILEGLISRGQNAKTDAALRQQWITSAKAALLGVLGSPHPTLEAFETAEHGGFYLPGMTDADILAQHNELLEQMIAVLKSTVEQLRWQLPSNQNQVFLPAGSSHDAYIEIRKIIRAATTEILIVDSYVDETLWQLLTNVSPAMKIRIMTTQMKGDFLLEGQKFVAQHGNKIEVRQTRLYHDRFVVIDSAQLWHLGCSIKDAGNKAFAMSEITSPSIVVAARGDVEVTWNAATPVPL